MGVRTLEVCSSRRQELTDVTEAIAELVRDTDCSAVLVYVPHTTAGVIIDEHADPDVARDILTALVHMVPSGTIYRHFEGNSSAHVKAAMISTSQIVPVDSGRLALGTWQGIFSLNSTVRGPGDSMYVFLTPAWRTTYPR
ncbi:MAG: secondary thiamine-phosphate synthase enzyme YjbQ [Chloroflexota bacterium]